MTTWVCSCGSPARESQWSYAAAATPTTSTCATARRRASTPVAGGGDLALHEVQHLGDGRVVRVDDQRLGAGVGDAPQHRHRLRDAEREVEPGHRAPAPPARAPRPRSVRDFGVALPRARGPGSGSRRAPRSGRRPCANCGNARPSCSPVTGSRPMPDQQRELCLGHRIARADLAVAELRDARPEPAPGRRARLGVVAGQRRRQAPVAVPGDDALQQVLVAVARRHRFIDTVIGAHLLAHAGARDEPQPVSGRLIHRLAPLKPTSICQTCNPPNTQPRTPRRQGVFGTDGTPSVQDYECGRSRSAMKDSCASRSSGGSIGRDGVFTGFRWSRRLRPPRVTRGGRQASGAMTTTRGTRASGDGGTTARRSGGVFRGRRRPAASASPAIQPPTSYDGCDHRPPTELAVAAAPRRNSGEYFATVDQLRQDPITPISKLEAGSHQHAADGAADICSRTDVAMARRPDRLTPRSRSSRSRQSTSTTPTPRPARSRLSTSMSAGTSATLTSWTRTASPSSSYRPARHRLDALHSRELRMGADPDGAWRVAGGSGPREVAMSPAA